MRLSLAGLLACALAAAPPAFAAQAPAVAFEVLRPGNYAGELRGMLCAACAEAIRRAVSQIRGVEKVSVDFETRLFSLTVAAGQQVPVSTLERALRQASKRINLQTEFSLEKLRYSA